MWAWFILEVTLNQANVVFSMLLNNPKLKLKILNLEAKEVEVEADTYSVLHLKCVNID